MSSHTEHITGELPYPSVTKIEGRPSYVTLKELKRQLKANAAAVPTDLGGGQHGFLGLLLLDLEYQTLAGELWVNPDNPGITAVIEPSYNAADRTQAYHEHKMLSEAWKKYTTVKNNLKQQVVA